MNAEIYKQSKVKQTEYVANLLYEKEFYDSSINRYYYCIYQRILKYLEKNPVEGIYLGQGSHNSTAIAFAKNIYRENKISELKFTRDFQNLKEHRKMADYDLDKLNKNHAQQARVYFKSLMDALDEKIGGD